MPIVKLQAGVKKSGISNFNFPGYKHMCTDSLLHIIMGCMDFDFVASFTHHAYRYQGHIGSPTSSGNRGVGEDKHIPVGCSHS